MVYKPLDTMDKPEVTYNKVSKIYRHFLVVSNKTTFALARVGHEMSKANSVRSSVKSALSTVSFPTYIKTIILVQILTIFKFSRLIKLKY